jgi:hypothetical protein
MSKTHNPFWTAGNPFTISAAASSEIGLEEQRDSRLSTDFVRCRTRSHVDDLQHALASDAVGEPGVGDEAHRSTIPQQRVGDP